MNRLMIALLALSAGLAQAADFSQTDARALCEAQVAESQAAQSDFEFRRNAMSSARGSSYTLMFNYKALEDGDRVARKVKCVVSKEGQLESLDVQNGRWNF